MTQKFPVLLRNCWFGLNYLFRNNIRSIPITTTQYTVLRSLYENKRRCLNQDDLAKLIYTNKNNLSSIIYRLKALGYVTLQKNNDRRCNEITLTATGQKLYLEAQKKAHITLDKLSEGMSDDEVMSLVKYLERFNKYFDC